MLGNLSIASPLIPGLLCLYAIFAASDAKFTASQPRLGSSATARVAYFTSVRNLQKVISLLVHTLYFGRANALLFQPRVSWSQLELRYLQPFAKSFPTRIPVKVCERLMLSMAIVPYLNSGLSLGLTGSSLLHRLSK